MKTNNNNTSEGDTEQYAAFDVHALGHVLRRGVWRIAACAFAGLLLSAGFAVMQPDVFEATATVQVEEENPSLLAPRTRL